MAPHSSGLAWRIPGTGEAGGLPSMGLHRVGHNWSDLAAAFPHYLQVCLYCSECEIKWSIESITMNKASEDNGIPVKLFQILNDAAVKVLHSTCQQIGKTQRDNQYIPRVERNSLSYTDIYQLPYSHGAGNQLRMLLRKSRRTHQHPEFSVIGRGWDPGLERQTPEWIPSSPPLPKANCWNELLFWPLEASLLSCDLLTLWLLSEYQPDFMLSYHLTITTNISNVCSLISN